LPDERARRDGMEREAGRRHQASLEAGRGPKELDVVTPAPEGPGESQTGMDVSGRSTPGDGDADGHDRLLVRSVLGAPRLRRGVRRVEPFGDLLVSAATWARPIDKRMPTAPRDTTSDGPPNEMSGRGTPVIGRTPVAPP